MYVQFSNTILQWPTATILCKQRSQNMHTLLNFPRSFSPAIKAYPARLDDAVNSFRDKETTEAENEQPGSNCVKGQSMAARQCNVGTDLLHQNQAKLSTS